MTISHKNTRLFDDGSQKNATTIPETVATIPAGTLRLLLSLIGYRAKARKESGGSRQWFRAAVPGRKHDAGRVPG